MKKILRAIQTLALSLGVGVLSAQAAPIPYVVEFTVTEVVTVGDTCPARLPPPYQVLQFDCDIAVGDKYLATFGLIDDSILALGNGSFGSHVEHFFAAIGGVIWAQDFPYPLSAYLGSIPYGSEMQPPLPHTHPPAGDPLGFQILGGEIVAFSQGNIVYGPADATSFQFYDPLTVAVWTTDFGYLYATYVIRQVPEPTMPVLLLLGFLWVAVRGGRSPAAADVKGSSSRHRPRF